MQNQTALDFVDVDLTTDVPVYIDPRAIRIQRGEFHESSINLLVSFFTEVLEGISRGDRAGVLGLLAHLDEPNETHLGVSQGRPKGRGLGGLGAGKIVDSLFESRAAETGLLKDLEDSALFIDGIGRDIISDITTNVIRKALISYTQGACEYHRIPLVEQYAGWVWDEDKLEWSEEYAQLPSIDGELLLLVPKSIVRTNLTLNPDRYYRAAIAPFHEEIEFKAGSSLVYALKNGEKRVRRDELIQKYGNSKSAIINHTKEYPQAFSNFKSKPDAASSPPLNHEKMAEKTRSDDPDFDGLLARVEAILPGPGGAELYHRAVGDLLAAVFYPHLANMKIEHEIHEGRKRIDLAYDNVADRGFFRWISLHHPASSIVVECKNYSVDPKNPELDQLSGRFSRDRTRFGIIVCRKIEDKDLWARRCRDTQKDARGFVFYLDDDDIRELTKQYYGKKSGQYPLLRKQYDYLVS